MSSGIALVLENIGFSLKEWVLPKKPLGDTGLQSSKRPPLTCGTSVGVWVPVILLRCSLDHDLILLSILDSEDGGKGCLLIMSPPSQPSIKTCYDLVPQV